MNNKDTKFFSNILNLKYILLILSGWPALSVASSKDIDNPRIVVSAGAGGFIADAGGAHTIPIFNSIEDEFFIYTPKNHSQAEGLLDLFMGGEWGLNPNWALQLGIGYTVLNAFNIQGSLIQGADIQSSDSYLYSYQAKTQQLQLQSKFLYNYHSNYHPYALLGLGAAFNKANHFMTNIPSFLTFTRMYQDNSTTSFTYNLGLGIDIDISENIRLGVGYRFTDFGKVKLGAATIDNLSVAGTLPQSSVHANLILAQISFIK